MPLDLDENKSTFQIRAYQPGQIKVNEQTLTQSIIITPSQLITDWRPQSAQELSTADLQPLINLKPAIVLIGTGGTHIFLAAEIYGELINLGMGVEVMSTIAACRTYNALSAEGRNVAAALLIR